MSGETTFGGWLKHRRKELGITQDEFAESIGCSLATLQKIEGGARRPSGQIAHLLADLLGIASDEREAFIVFARAGRADTGSTPLDHKAASNGSGMNAPWRAISLNRTNLPVVLTALIGRGQEEGEACAHLLSPKTRLLSLIGAPGVGKTRLALQVASDVAEHFEDGVYFIDLAAVVDPDMVLPTIARTLGLKEAGELPVEGTLQEHVRERKLLLVLDNFEQVLDAAPALVNMMQASPWLKVLVTSREALHVRGERRFSLVPLAVPDHSLYAQGKEGKPSRSLTPATLAAYPSVELFTERAQAVSSEFELTQENAGEVAAICSALEGLPLAIELAAARAGHFSPAEIYAALGSGRNLPLRGARDAPARQRTLKNAFSWSYGLLDPSEQKLFRRLSVFVHGCTLEAVESVCNAAADLGTPVAEAIMSLVEKSLVVRSHMEGVTRFTMLETIREYALDELEANQEEPHTRQQHAYYCSSLVDEAETYLGGPEQTAWLNKLGADHDNVRAALNWLLADGAGDEALVRMSLQISADMARFWFLRGYLTEGREWLGATLRNAEPLLNGGDDSPVELYVRALDMAGRLAWAQGDYPTAQSLWESGLARNQALGDRQRSAHLLNGLAQLALDRLSYQEAISLYQEGLSLARQVDDKPLIAKTLNNIANVYRNMMDYPAARQCYEDSLLLFREIGDKTSIVVPLNNLGLVSMDMEDSTAARRYLEEALHLCRELDQKNGLAFALSFLGQLEVRESDFGRAAYIYSEALSLAGDLGAKSVLANCIEGVASIQEGLGRPLEAAWLWGNAAALREAMDLPLPLPGRPRYERSIASARAHADSPAFDAAWAEGRTAIVEEALKYAQAVLSRHYC